VERKFANEFSRIRGAFAETRDTLIKQNQIFLDDNIAALHRQKSSRDDRVENVMIDQFKEFLQDRVGVVTDEVRLILQPFQNEK